MVLAPGSEAAAHRVMDGSARAWLTPGQGARSEALMMDDPRRLV